MKWHALKNGLYLWECLPIPYRASIYFVSTWAPAIEHISWYCTLYPSPTRHDFLLSLYRTWLRDIVNVNWHGSKCILPRSNKPFYPAKIPKTTMLIIQSPIRSIVYFFIGLRHVSCGFTNRSEIISDIMWQVNWNVQYFRVVLEVCLYTLNVYIQVTCISQRSIL